MLSVFVDSFSQDDPLSGLRIGDRPEPVVPDGWTVIDVKAASINFHDIWSLRGVGPRGDDLPMILGCDAAGIDAEGREVVVHAVINDGRWDGDELADPQLSLFSEKHQGTFAQQLAVPRRNLVVKPPAMSFAEAACLPTAWLTAYRMLFTQAGLSAGDLVLVQGGSGGLSTAAILLGKAAGLTVWATGRDEASRQVAAEHGADAVFAFGTRLPNRVDAVIDSVGASTWTHSLKALRVRGTMVVPGATSGFEVHTNVARLITKQLRIIGSMMGTLEEFSALIDLCDRSGVRPPVQAEIALTKADDGFRLMLAGRLSGKVVLVP